MKSVLSSYPDDELVIRAQENDDEAFGELMRRTSASSFRLAVSILRDRQEAEDEVQNSYLNAWRHVSQFQRESKFSTWISRIVVNQCLMRLRKVRAANFVYIDDPGSDERARQHEVIDGSETPEMKVRNTELTRVLQTEIGRLPPLLRHVLVMRDVDELPTAEVAMRLGMTVSAVKSRLLRARVELRHRMEKHDGGTRACGLPA